jgi:hypothetical protein
MQWLLLIAALCLVAQSTVLPLASPATSGWTPVHQHITLNGVVPPHTHAYDTPGGQRPGQPACSVTDTSSGVGTTHAESIVCAPGDDGATASTTVAAHHGPSIWQLRTTGFESLTLPTWHRVWSSISVSPLTPPPRS